MRHKIYFFSILSLLAGGTLNAQFSKGDRMVGATVASAVFNSGTADINVAQIGSNTSTVKNYNVSLTPSLGWFISENTAVGFVLNINPNGQKTSYEQGGSTYQSDQSNGFNIGGGGFARSYFGKTGSFLPFGQATVNAGASNLKTEGFFYYTGGTPYFRDTYTGKSTGGFFFNGTLAAGLTKMMGENAGLDIFLGYTYSSSKNTFKRTKLFYDTNTATSPIETRENETTTKFTNHGFQLGIGFQVFLRGKGK